jgi:hypothetical protein
LAAITALTADIYAMNVTPSNTMQALNESQLIQTAAILAAAPVGMRKNPLPLRQKWNFGTRGGTLQATIP